ncbi:transcriptional regulator [Massilia sp. CT11-137]|uniref:transcriptional regulator n=1 Tax=Massilia sp. CT11-137 TaxID=3393901 RepID=UPI0039AEA14B
MNLPTYLQTPGLNKAAFAREIGVSNAMLYQFEKGIRPVPPKYCPAIERASDGKVTRQELRPKDWRQTWPDLAAQHPPAPHPESQPQ